VIDSHLHVWADSAESSSEYKYSPGQDPPDALRDQASVAELLGRMRDAGFDGALIVQPINHKFDHSYVSQRALRQHPDKFKGMLLYDPGQADAEVAIAQLEELKSQGFVGVRFNPYLWPPSAGDQKWTPMSSEDYNDGTPLKVYKRCGELRMPVGVMCFQGLELHHDDIVQLLKASPSTPLIIDHFGFTKLSPPPSSAPSGGPFEQLLSLAEYPQVYVKISALFRLGDSSSAFERVRMERFRPLLKAFGADRLMWGSDFPFVLQEETGYQDTLDLVASWLEDDCETDEQRAAIMSGTAERLFGTWG